MYKRILVVFLLSMLVLGCSDSSDPQEAADLTTNPDLSELARSASSLGPDAYSVIVMDRDNWEIRLNIKRDLTRVTCYEGELWYKSGSSEFGGPASATYY